MDRSQRQRRRINVAIPYHATTFTFILVAGALLFSFAQFKLLFHTQMQFVDYKNSIPVDRTEIHEKTIPEVFSLESTKAWPNVTTVAWRPLSFYSGFCNQLMAFIFFAINALQNGDGQIMLESIKMKDTYGTNKHIKFDKIWDVSHFNSFYPRLPRLVNCDDDVMWQFNCSKNDWYWSNGSYTDRYGNNPEDECSSPFADRTRQHYAMEIYMFYTQGKKTDIDVPIGGRHPADILMLQGALRPHPTLQKVIDLSMRSLVNSRAIGNDLNMKVEFIALHARVEPDMQKHVMCLDKKVLNLTDIFYFMERMWPDPPAQHILLAINRQLLELEGRVNKEEPSKTNWIAVENLRTLNDAKVNGLWNGQAKLFEFGSKALKGTEYEKLPSISGSVLNYFISMNAKIFIGTEVSSYSHSLMTARFFRNNKENYKYLSSGIHSWTPPNTKQPDGFFC